MAVVAVVVVVVVVLCLQLLTRNQDWNQRFTLRCAVRAPGADSTAAKRLRQQSKTDDEIFCR